MGKDRWSHGNRGGSKRGGFNNRGGFGRGRGRAGFRGHWQSGNRDRVNNETWQKFPVEPPVKRLSEEEIGVTEYMSEHEGFNGIIKSRFSDFQVSEVNELGEVAKLTDMAPPEPVAEEVTEDEELLLSKYNVEILPMDTWDKINKVSIGDDSNVQTVEIDVTTTSKEERTKIHDAVKKAFGESIIGSTINVDNMKLMRFQKYRKGVRFDNRVKWTWGGEYVHFIVHKEHCDTMEAAVRISDRLRMLIKPSQLGYAGTKDRRAKTSQWFSLKKTDPRKIASACKGLSMISVGNFSFKDYGLKLGSLRGNQFRIALRNVTAEEAAVRAACARVARRGFLNYYGLQRFGTRRDVPTHRVGRCLLRGEYKEAIDNILSARAGPAAGGRASPEARVLAALARCPHDMQAALFKVPRNTRLLYLHSYQSLIWNNAVSERIKRFGLEPVVGDLVPLTKDSLKEEPEDCESDGEENQETSENTQSSEKMDTLQNESTNKIKEKTRVEQITPVKVLTQEDIDNKTYTIFDVIMPLPGYLIEYPPNIKDYYETLLNNDGLNLTLKNKNKNYSMSGAYRRIAIKPEKMEWKTVRYTDPYGDLILSDIDELKGRTTTAAVDDGKYKAVLLSFTLPASCYATMALRELLKVDTSSVTQATQNDYHKRKRSGSESKSEDNTEKRLKGSESNVEKGNSEDGTVVKEESQEGKTVNDESVGGNTDNVDNVDGEIENVEGGEETLKENQ